MTNTICTVYHVLRGAIDCARESESWTQRTTGASRPLVVFVKSQMSSEMKGVTFKSAEEELRELLADYPLWVERILWKNPSPINLRPYPGLVEKYESILPRIPKKWREYRRAKRLYAQRVLGPPRATAGRPRKDALAEEAQQLKSGGKSYAQVASTLNRKHGEGCTTAEAIRKLLASRKKEQSTTPDKTS
jgi:hypothetical protein